MGSRERKVEESRGSPTARPLKTLLNGQHVKEADFARQPCGHNSAGVDVERDGACTQGGPVVERNVDQG